MKHSDSIAKLAPALVKVQAEVKSISKDSTNPHFKNKYASLDTITETVRPLLAKHGFALVQGATTPISDVEGRLTAITLETRLVHESGEWIANNICLPTGGVKGEPTAQSVGGAVTYGRRYGLAAILALTTDEDDDGGAASAPARAPKAAAKAPAKKKAADRTITGPNGPVRLGDLSTEELVKLKAKAAENGKTELTNAIDEVLVERENDSFDRADTGPYGP